MFDIGQYCDSTYCFNPHHVSRNTKLLKLLLGSVVLTGWCDLAGTLCAGTLCTIGSRCHCAEHPPTWDMHTVIELRVARCSCASMLRRRLLPSLPFAVACRGSLLGLLFLAASFNLDEKDGKDQSGGHYFQSFGTAAASQDKKYKHTPHNEVALSLLACH
jgi:hypothetical protein